MVTSTKSVMLHVVAAARAAWPTVDLATDLFAAYLADRTPDDVAFDAAVRHLHASDLYLACACVNGDPNAIAAFELHCLTVVDRALPRLSLDADAVAEVKQRLRRALLIADQGPPRLTKFAGRGDLRCWIRVLAVREALAIARQARAHVTIDEDRLVDLVAAGASPELEYFKRLYRRELEIAFRGAVQALSDHERTLIGQHFLDGISIQQLGRLHRVHRVTAARWLDCARDKLVATTRALLMDRLGVPPTELESILRLVLSRLDLSLRPLFGRR